MSKFYPLHATIDTASELQQAFREVGRDQYPTDFYGALLDYLDDIHTESESVMLDIIGLCCDISETQLKREQMTLDELESQTSVIYYDESSDTAYHWAY